MATQTKFPEEITYEILYNLRVKSLSRFKCVSKRWRSIISSKEFIKRHLEKSNTDPDITRHRILLRLHHRCLQQNTVLLHSLRSLLYGPNATFDNLPQQTNLLTRVWGSCNGLTLMFVNNARLVLLNLSSRKLKIVPPFPEEGGEYAPRHDTDRFIYGLGYDESADDYKVVCIYTVSNSKPYRTQMYSSKTDCWKKIEDFDKGIVPVEDSGKFVNGKLHWLAKNENGGRDHEIVALDLVEGKYEIMARPENFSNSVPYQPILGDLGGYLSLIGHVFVSDTAGNMLDTSVWVMKEYGVRESWTKIWTLSDFHDPKNCTRGALPLCFRDNGDIAVAFGSSIVVYNGKNKLREIRGAIVNDIIESLVYVESLVSPFGDEELGH